MSLTISHTPAEGSLVCGTSRGDGTAEILKREGWRWGRTIEAWYLPRSRDRAPQRRTIERTGAQLRAAGFDVEISVDDTHRSTAEVETDLLERQNVRTARLEERSQRRAAQAAAAEDASTRAHDAVPPMGEPIKVGHHSETRHRRAIAKASSAMQKSIEADRAADQAADAASRAAQAAERRYAPMQVVRRLERIESELGTWRRRRDGSSRRLSNGMVDVTPPAEGDYAERVRNEIDRLTDELDYWRGVRELQIAEGAVIEHSRETIQVGDLIQFANVWGKVTRLNPKSATAIGAYGKMIAPYPQITGHRAQPEVQR